MKTNDTKYWVVIEPKNLSAYVQEDGEEPEHWMGCFRFKADAVAISQHINSQMETLKRSTNVVGMEREDAAKAKP